MGVCMNLTTINCTLFVVITYFLTCIIAWCLPFKDITLLTTFVPASVAILLTIYNKQKVRDLFKLSSPKKLSIRVYTYSGKYANFQWSFVNLLRFFIFPRVFYVRPCKGFECSFESISDVICFIINLCDVDHYVSW